MYYNAKDLYKFFWHCTGGRDVDEADDIFILVAPQNAMGNCIIDVKTSDQIFNTNTGHDMIEQNRLYCI